MTNDFAETLVSPLLAGVGVMLKSRFFVGKVSVGCRHEHVNECLAVERGVTFGFICQFCFICLISDSFLIIHTLDIPFLFFLWGLHIYGMSDTIFNILLVSFFITLSVDYYQSDRFEI